MAFPQGALLALVFLSILLLWIPMQQQTTQSLHYKVLDVPRNASSEEIEAAYRRIKASPDLEHDKLQKVEHAFNVLSNEFRRRDYDHFGLDKVQAVSQQEVHPDITASATPTLNVKDLNSVLESEEPWLIQIYSVADVESMHFAGFWERLGEALQGQVKLGRVELGEFEAAKFLSEKNVFGKPVFRQGLPELIAFPPNCKELKCIQRYSNELSYNYVLDWIASEVLNLPRILYYHPHNLGPDFLHKTPLHKVKVIIFSETGERAASYMREAARKYSDYASFGCVLWRQDEAFVWKSRLGVESAPAIVFLRDPGLQPVVIHGKLNRTSFMELMEEHKTHVLPQLRSITADNLGCNPAGYSIAGEEILTWYCAIAVGKPGYKLDQLRSIMRSVEEELESDEVDENLASAVTAFREKRLRLSWLDGAAQKKLCYYFLGNEGQSSCGAKQYAEEDDEPRVLLIRFRRDPEAQQQQQQEKPTNFWQQAFSDEGEEDLASLLIARYNGNTEEVSEILSWMASTVRDGDTQEIPFFKMKSAPALIPEEASTPMLLKTSSLARRTGNRALENGRKLVIDVLDTVQKSDTKLTAVLMAMISICFIRYIFRR